MRMAFGRRIPETLEELLAEPCAVVVWDMQEAIAGRASNLAQLRATLPRLLGAARERGVPVIYSRHYSPPLEYEDRSWIRLLWKGSGVEDPATLRAPYPAGSAGGEFIPETAPEDGDLVIPKTRPSFFVGTPLRSALAARGIDLVLMTGVATDRGVLTTVRDGANHGVMAVVVTDAVGSFSEADQQRGLDELGAICDLCRTDDVLAAWAANDGAGRR